MARANAGTWIKLVAGVVVGAAAVPLSMNVLPVAVSGSALLAAPLPERSLPVHEALTNAIACHRRGEYEAAAELFKSIEQRQDELSDSEKKEWYQFWHENVVALEARHEGDHQLRLIDKAILEGRIGDATDLLKKVVPYEQYLTADDKAKYREMYSRLMGKPMELPKPIPVPSPLQPSLMKPFDTSNSAANAGPGKPTLADGRAKLQQARAQLNQANIDVAEKLVRETERLGVTFPPAEDTPAKVLQDIAKARGDAKILLLAARAAMGRQEFDAAEKYAKQSEALAGTFTFPLWASDCPSKCLKELKELKDTQTAKAPNPPANHGNPATGTPATPTPPANVTTTSSNKPAMPVQAATNESDRARTLVQQGRKALLENQLALAKQLAEQANALHPDLAYWEDSPEKLLADVGRAETQAGAHKPTSGPDQKPPTTKEEAGALVKLARTQLAEGKIEDAQVTAMKARAVKNVSWNGIFDDPPDSALKDIEKARVKRDQEESVKVLAAGRKLLEKGDWEGAQRAAYHAQKLHGPYQFYEMGDRPDKLLADAQVLRNQPHKPDVTVAKHDDKKPDWKPATPLPTLPTPANPPAQAMTTPPVTPPAVAMAPVTPPVVATPSNPEALRNQAQQMLREARAALKSGDIAKAKQLTDQVATMKVTFAPHDDCPALVYEEINKCSRAPVGPGVGEPVMKVQPAQPQANATKMTGYQLLAEGRRLQNAGRLIEAQQKSLQAQASGATFGPNDDNPVRAVQEIASMAQQRVDTLSIQATDLAHYGSGDPLTRYQQADQMLQEAMHLAGHFGFDVSSLNLKLADLQNLRAQATGQPVQVLRPEIQLTSQVQTPVDPPHSPRPPVDPAQHGSVPAPLPQGVDLVKQGRQLLDQARNELRAGALGQARKLAMDAMKEEYGVADEAAAVLRTIDTEAFNRKCRDDQIAFDAAVVDFQRHDYAHASLLISAIDQRNLNEKRKNQLRELMQTPEMLTIQQPTAVAQVEPLPNGGKELLPSISGTAPTDDGHAHATDMQPATPEKDILKDTAAMHNVLFQKLRADGLKAQNDAADKFRTGQTDQALDVLKQYLADLDMVRELNANQLTSLRKPVENRLKHFELMKLQEDFQKQDKVVSSKTMDAHSRRLAAEDAKQKKVADLTKQCTALIKDHKFEEGYRLAMLVKELDPDNAVVEALVIEAEMNRNLHEAQVNKDNLAEYFRKGLNDTDRYGNYLDNDNPMEINLDRSKNAKLRPSLDQILQHKTAAMIQMENKLMTPTTINIKDVAMRQAINDLRQQYALNFDFDDASLQNQGISLDRLVTLQLDGVMLKTALELLLKKLSLSFTVKEDHIEITTKENARGQIVRRVFPVTDLIVPVENSIQQAPGTPLLPGQQNTNGSSGLSSIGTNNYAPPTPTGGAGYGTLMPGTPTGDPSGTRLQNPTDQNEIANQYGHTIRRKKMLATREDALIKLITNTIDPNSWSDAGGQGTIDYYPMGGALVINQTLDIEEQVADLLQALRRLQDQEVAIEVRLITVDEDYYERIGLDFSMNISTNARNNKFVPAILANSFTPPNQFNSIQQGANGLLAGITPAGTLTPDLSIPIQPNSFTPAAPTFGGYQGSGVGGLALGLAFLSDIQVSMFLEAVAGDARSSISQSPRLTLQNGQQATISIIDNLENLVTGITLTQLPNGGFALVPQVQPINNEVDLQLSAVISADRRFVRLSPQLNLNNVSIGNPAPAPTPILLPIYPNLSVTDPGNSVVYTQYIQQPQRISTINITTTVTVPDGGTVVMGGLKRMSEGRLEYGPPVLSKIPYIDRLFRNVGYGRSGTSILIMVTPRIIIQEEEEERATGFRIGPAVQP